MTGYTRQDSIIDGEAVNAIKFNSEYDQLVATFDATTGHTHDGSSGQGGVISGIVKDYSSATVYELGNLTTKNNIVYISQVIANVGNDPVSDDGSNWKKISRVEEVNLIQTKIDAIEAGATTDQTSSQIKVSYESNSNTNALTDLLKNKLDAIEDDATADQTSSQIKVSYESNSNTNSFTDTEKTKLSNSVTASDVIETNLDTLSGSVFFKVDQNSVGSPSLGYNYDANGWQVDTSGQTVQYLAVGTNDKLLMRTDDGSGFNSWESFVFVSSIEDQLPDSLNITNDLIAGRNVLVTNDVWLQSNDTSVLYGKTNAGLGKRLAYITSADVATFGDGGVESNYRGLNGSLQINNTDGVLIEQTGSNGRPVKLKSLGAVEIEVDSNNSGGGDDFIIRNGGETVILHNGVRTILTGIATSFPLRIIGADNTFMEYYDSNSGTYRGLGWDNTTNRFELEDDSGAYNEVVHSGNIASNLPSTLSPSLDVNVGRNLDVTGASTFDGLVTEKANRKLVDFGTVTTSGSYLIDNPFGNSNWLDCDAKAMILYNSKWIDTGWLYSGSGYGVKAQSRSDGILVVTGGSRLASSPQDGGGGADSNGNQLTSASCKVVVTYHGDTTNA